MKWNPLLRYNKKGFPKTNPPPHIKGEIPTCITEVVGRTPSDPTTLIRSKALLRDRPDLQDHAHLSRLAEEPQTQHEWGCLTPSTPSRGEKKLPLRTGENGAAPPLNTCVVHPRRKSDWDGPCAPPFHSLPKTGGDERNFHTWTWRYARGRPQDRLPFLKSGSYSRRCWTVQVTGCPHPSAKASALTATKRTPLATQGNDKILRTAHVTKNHFA